MAKLRYALAIGLAVLLAATAAMGQDLDQARKLFKRGLDDMLAGRYDTGCPTLAESYRLSKLPGALFTLAECEAKWGKQASALGHYEEYLALFVTLTPEQREKQRKRKQIATEQVGALRGVVPMLTVSLPKDAPEGSVVKADGEELAPEMLGVPFPVDPGDHQISLELPDGQKVDQVAALKSGERREVVLELPGGQNGLPDPGGSGGSGEQPPDSATGDTMRLLGWSIGGLGVAGVIVGAITGGMAFGEREKVLDNCVDTVCNPEGKDAADTTQLLGNVSTVGFVVGGVAIATGVVLLLTAPSDEQEPEARRGWRLLAGGSAGEHAGGFVGLQGTW